MRLPRVLSQFTAALAALSTLAFGGIAPTASAQLLAATASTPAAGWTATRTRAHLTAYAVADDLGAITAAEDIPIVVTLQLRDAATLTALTDRSGTRGATTVPLTRQQFLDRHAPTAEQAERVAAYLRAQGFRNVAIAANRMLVTADGTPDRIRTAFQAELHRFDVAGRRAYANVSDARVPATLSDTVLAVLGLQNVHLAHTNARRASPVNATRLDATTAAVVGIAPTQFARLYGADGLPSAATTTIGVITQGSMTQTVADLKAFASAAGYPVPNVGVVLTGSASSDAAGVDEWNLDTQVALAAAGGTVAGVLLYTSPTLRDADLTVAYNRAVSDNLAKVVNVSLGECESSANASGVRASNDQIFQAAVAQGQTFSVASGDSGAYGCGGSTPAQSYPAVSPYVMAIGGTTLSTSGGAWAGETVWGCSGPTTCPQSASGGTGGGPSLTEAAPSWQTAAGVLPIAGRRGVPDLAFDAAPSSGAIILINGSYYQIGGTSLSAPLFAGFYARVQAAHGNTLGFPAQALYAGAASNPSWFHDVTSGSNGGYAAGAGWDYTTGFGSLQVQNWSASLTSGGTASDWTTIATEGQTFTVSGTQTVRYGAGSSWVTKTVTGSGICSNAFFGNDPAYGTVKSCQVAGASSTTPTPTPTPTGWATIAGEGQNFTVSGTQTVRYGAGSAWITKTVTGGGTCSNDFFGGDPAYGTVKSCQVSSTPAAVTWTRVASEGQAFGVTGTKTVRYGANSSFVTKTVTNGGTCSNDFFGGDPLYGVAKACDVAN